MEYSYSEYFLYKWSTRLQSMRNHMVGQAATVVSPFFSLLLDPDWLNVNLENFSLKSGEIWAF